MIVNAGYRGKVGAAAQKFTYTGQYNVRKDGVVELLTSGTLVFLNPAVVDIFCVGGGGGGSFAPNNSNGGGGGGGGYTLTNKHVSVNGSYIINVGAGGAPSKDGESTSFGTIMTAEGGKAPTTSARRTGGNGGSGGGGGRDNNSTGGTGGSNGTKGTSGGTGFSTNPGGTGQNSTTSEFGEIDGKLYSGGGGGGTFISSTKPVVAAGGSGGGGAGAWRGTSVTAFQEAGAGGANTGGGGGGGARNTEGTSSPGGSGGSGIVCFRDAQELPELAGTWVLNQRLYAPESILTYTGQCTYGSNSDLTALKVDPSSYFYAYNGPQEYELYRFSTNQWQGTKHNLIFPAGATASDQFRAWLANNATKQ